LAREAGADEIDGNSIGSEAFFRNGSHVIVNRHLGPVFAEYGLRLLVDLAERDGLEPIGSFQAKVEAPDASEERKDAQH